MFSYKNL